MQKKILIVNKMYWPDIGGIETIVKQYAEYFADKYEVTVLTSSGSLKLKIKKELINGVKIIRCPSFGIIFSMPLSFTIVLKLFFMRNKFDLIHFHEPYPLASFIGLFPKRAKYIVTWHSDIIKQKKIKKPIEFLQKKLCAKADVILTTSPNLMEFSAILRLFKSKTQILPLSINLNNYYQQDNPIGEFALYIGRLSYYKGIGILLRAFEKSKTSIPLYIVGNGEKKIVDEINNFIRTSTKKIIFINKYVSEEEKNNFLKNCRYLLFPSILPSEAFGIIQLEAMAFSKPVINTNLPTGVPWVSINKETGITVDIDNEEELSEAIDTLSNDELVFVLGKNARNRVATMFSDEAIFARLNEIYNNILQ